MVWGRTGGILPDGSSSANGVLMINNAQPADSGNYTCLGASKTVSGPTLFKLAWDRAQLVVEGDYVCDNPFVFSFRNKYYISSYWFLILFFLLIEIFHFCLFIEWNFGFSSLKITKFVYKNPETPVVFWELQMLFFGNCYISLGEKIAQRTQRR